MPITFKKTAFSLLSLLYASVFFAQGVPDTSVLSRRQPPSTKLQHSIAFMVPDGIQYDIRFRTPNKTTDFYAAVNGIFFSSFRYIGLQGGVLFGNWHGLSLGAGVLSMYGATDYMTFSDNEAYRKKNVILGLPVGIRYQPSYHGFFAQLNCVPMLNLTDGTSTAIYPQIQLGFSFGGKNPNAPHDTTTIPQGLQHSAYAQIANFGLGLAYDARFRTKIRWLDWAATASAGMLPKTNTGRAALGTSLGGSALFGKRALSFELGVQGVLSHYEQQEISYRDYKTGEYSYYDVAYDQNSIEVLFGLRYQRPKRGISGFINFGAGPSYNSRYPTFSSFQGTVRLGLGYSLATR